MTNQCQAMLINAWKLGRGLGWTVVNRINIPPARHRPYRTWPFHCFVIVLPTVPVKVRHVGSHNRQKITKVRRACRGIGGIKVKWLVFAAIRAGNFNDLMLVLRRLQKMALLKLCGYG